jgi:hypothetical protein
VCVWVYMYINGGRQRKYSKTLDPISWTRRLRVLQLKIEKNKNNPTYPRKHERRFLQVVPIFLRLQIEKKDLLASNGVQPVWNQPASFQWPTLHSVIITSIGPSCTNLFSLTPTWHTHTHTDTASSSTLTFVKWRDYQPNVGLTLLTSWTIRSRLYPRQF